MYFTKKISCTQFVFFTCCLLLSILVKFVQADPRRTPRRTLGKFSGFWTKIDQFCHFFSEKYHQKQKGTNSHIFKHQYTGEPIRGKFRDFGEISANLVGGGFPGGNFTCLVRNEYFLCSKFRPIFRNLDKIDQNWTKIAKIRQTHHISTERPFCIFDDFP